MSFIFVGQLGSALFAKREKVKNEGKDVDIQNNRFDDKE